MIDQLIHLLTSSPSSTGLGIIMAAVIAPLMVFCRTLPVWIYQKIVNTLTITLVIDESPNMSGSDIFQNFNTWVVQNRVEWFTRVFELNTFAKITAGQGFNLIWYKNSLMWSNMIRHETKGERNEKVGTYNLRTFKWNRDKLNNLIETSCQLGEDFKFIGRMNSMDKEGDIKSLVEYPPYIKNQKQIINKEKYNELDTIISNFVNGEKDYLEKGKPYKETILLYGPPGTGKTNISRHFGAKYNFDLVSVSPECVTDQTLTKITWYARCYKGKTLYLIEDICSHPNYTTTPSVVSADNSENSSDNKLTKNVSLTNVGTLSTFLNALDGAIPLHNCLVIITTNNVNLLHKSIYRAGRVDHLIHMDYVNFETALDYLEWKPNEQRSKELEKFKDKLHVATLRDLKFATSLEDVKTILKGGEICLKLPYHKEK